MRASSFLHDAGRSRCFSKATVSRFLYSPLLSRTYKNRSVSERLFQRRAQLIAGGFHAVDPTPARSCRPSQRLLTGSNQTLRVSRPLDGLSGGKSCPARPSRRCHKWNRTSCCRPPAFPPGPRWLDGARLGKDGRGFVAVQVGDELLGKVLMLAAAGSRPARNQV